MRKCEYTVRTEKEENLWLDEEEIIDAEKVKRTSERGLICVRIQGWISWEFKIHQNTEYSLWDEDLTVKKKIIMSFVKCVILHGGEK